MFDVKGYLLGELDEADRRVVEEHVAICQECREELDRLRLTEAAMLTVRDVEIPKRIAFVSDKIFEPKWWQRLWQSGPRLGFASALVLAVAIVAHGFLQPPPVKGPEPLNTAEVARMVEKEVSARVTAAVEQAVAETERRRVEARESIKPVVIPIKKGEMIIRDGETQQIGTPDEIYNNPANTFVARFVGSPVINLIEADVDNGVGFVQFHGHRNLFVSESGCAYESKVYVVSIQVSNGSEAGTIVLFVAQLREWKHVRFGG
jgi:anti-sigma factor RsiW